MSEMKLFYKIFLAKEFAPIRIKLPKIEKSQPKDNHHLLFTDLTSDDKDATNFQPQIIHNPSKQSP